MVNDLKARANRCAQGNSRALAKRLSDDIRRMNIWMPSRWIVNIDSAASMPRRLRQCCGVLVKENCLTANNVAYDVVCAARHLNSGAARWGESA